MSESTFTQTPTVVGLIAFAKSLGVTLEMSEDANAFAIEWISNQGKPGAGAQVMAHAIARSDEINKPLILDAHEGNAKLIDYYAKLGFKPWTGELREFGGEWAHGMRREPENPAVLAFKSWFADSKVVDDAGKPRVVYHGTSASFDAFEAKHAGNSSEHATADLGFYFSSDPRVAAIFCRESTGWDEDDLKTEPSTPYFDGANTMPVHLRIENPYRMEPAEFIDLVEGATGKQVRAKLARLKLMQHDGVFIPKAEPYLNAELVGETWIAFQPEQIKSALSNGGAYDPQNPDITDGAAQRVLDAMQARSLVMLMTPKNEEGCVSSESNSISAHASGDVVWIDMMAIPKAERGKGAGRADYTQWEEALPPNVTRVQILASDTGAGNSAAFWEKMGFAYQYEGENLDYESAHSMWKGVNGHATPPTVNVDDEDEEERLAQEERARDQVAQTAKSTNPNFDKWFSGSLVVNAAGEPLVVYHGTMANFTVFHDGEDGGTYFSPSKATAEFFSENSDRGWDDQVEPRVIDAYLAIKNPKVLNDAQLSELIGDPDDRDWTGMPSVIEEAKEEGHDGLHLVDVTGDTPQESGDQWVAFSPNQIKSASANTGGFDPEDPDYTDQKYGLASNAQKAIDWLQQPASKKAAPHA